MIPQAKIELMYADYQAEMSLAGVERKYDVGRSGAREIFSRRGLALRPPPKRHTDPVTGSWVPRPRATAAEIDAMIAQLDRIKIPEPLRWEWRMWGRAQRAKFLARLRRRVKPKSAAPSTPYFNIEPFDYTSKHAWAIADKLNAGLPANQWKVHMKVSSQGVIWRETLYFWSHKCGYQYGSWIAGRTRPLLHWVAWEFYNQRKVPPKHQVIHLDGNKNNFTPSNLALRSKAECARLNMRAAIASGKDPYGHLGAVSIRRHTKHSRDITSLLLKKSQEKNNEHSNTLSQLHARRS